MNIKKRFLSLLLAGMAMVGGVSAADQLAFPGAAGWGRFAKGARAASAPTVYHVTNLNDSGSGSLRDAVSQPNRIVVFDVSGVIKINSRMIFKNNLYIAGQTAPGEGITVYGNGVSFSGASNIICRYLRVRMGHGGDSGKDCAGISNGTNMIFDHCSFSWGLDETFSINPDGKGAIGDITIQNTIVGQGLLSHSAGGLMQADHITLYRNLYIDNSTRNNKVKGTNQYANNVVYNWQNGCYIMGGDSEGSSYVNIESNLFINGPAKGGNALGGGNLDFHYYGNDNWQDSNMDGVFNPSCIDNTQTGGGDKVSKRFDYPELELYKGNELLEKNIPTVGASLPYRDQSDCYMIDELMSLGKQGKIITYETSLPIGAPDTWAWWQGSKPADTDGDGMPDAWEDANGLNKNDKSDAVKTAANGYLNIENYINSITVEDRQFFLRAPITLELSKATTSTLTIAWRDYTYAEDGFIIEVNGKEAGRALANATSFTLEGLNEATIYDVKVRAFASIDGKEQYSEYAVGKFATRQSEAGIIDIDTYQPNVTLGDNQTVWDDKTTDWKEGKAYKDGDKVLLTANSDKSLTINGDVYPESVVANGTGTLTMQGTIMGTASVNHAGTGTLILSDQNTYTGATVNHEGVVEFSKIADGGQLSSLGASIADPQNWIMDGGTFRYTGGAATTNRGARITAPSTLEIANNVKLTANGSFEGTSDLTIDGKGTLAIADAANFFKYTGATILKGNIDFTDIEKGSKAFGSLGKKVIMSGGKLSGAMKNEDKQTHSFTMEMAEGTTSTFVCPNHGNFKCKVSGTGNLILDLPYLRYYIDSDFSNFSGQLIVHGIGTSGTSVFMPSTQFNSPKLRVNLTGRTQMGAWATNANNVVGGISGDAGTYLFGSSKSTSGFKCSWTVGGANSDETFKGIINDWSTSGSGYTGTTSIIKEGTGLWRLTGANSYKGTTTVNGGTLIIDGTHSGTGAVTVNSGATLKGQGTITAAVTVKSGATLAAGDTIMSGKKLTIKGAVTLSSGATLQVPLVNNDTKAYAQNNFAFTTLNIANGAVLELDMANVTKSLEKNKCFTVFATVPKTVTGQFTISPATPGEGLEWDTTTLFTDGKLYIIEKGGKREEDKPEKPEDDPAGETLHGMINWGNSVNGSYDNSSYLNMMTGGDNEEARGFKLVCTGNLQKPLQTGGTSPSKVSVEFNGEVLQRTPIKMSNGAQETIFLPEDAELGKARATKITFVSIMPGFTTSTLSTARTSYWKEVCGTTFTAADAEKEGNIITATNDMRSNPSIISFDLNNVEQITFTNAGEQQAAIFIIEYHYGGPAGTGCVSGTTAVNNASATIPQTGVIYNLNGQPVDSSYKGYVIINGKVVKK